MRTPLSAFAGVLLGLLALATGPARAQVADLNEIGTDPRRAVIVDVMLLENGTAEFVETYVSDVPPGSSIGNPQQIRLDALNATSVVIGTEYSWDPRWVFFEAKQPDDDGVVGEQLEVQPEALGSFAMLFDKDMAAVRVTDVEATTELITVDVRFVVEKFCSDDAIANPGNTNPECTGITYSDADADSTPDVLDNCIDVDNPGQVDSDADGFGNFCDADLNNNGATNAQDYVLFRQQLGMPSVPPAYNSADLNGNGAVNAQDYVLFRQMLGQPPGPSGLHP